MAPLLIDGRDLLKLVLFSAVVVIAVFSSGIFVGHQRAATFYQAGIDVHPLLLPERNVVADHAIESQKPVAIEAGEFIDVDNPESAVKSVTKDTGMPVMMSASQMYAAIQEDDEDVPARVIKKHERSVVSEVVTSIPLKQKSDEKDQKNPVNAEQDVASVQPDAHNASMVTSVRVNDLDEIKYSIQVGVYGRLANAENMMKMLQVEQYEAYITDYTNKKNETRYNVRFGYFQDKKSALTSLEKFKSDNNDDGYLVKFSSDNIVNLADAGKTNTPLVQIEDHEKSSKPAVTPSVTTTDNISQADVLTDTLIKAN
jgi:cell division septation protein DedD